MAKHTKNVYKKKFSKFMQKKLVLLFVAIILAFAVLIGRITYINASSGSSYTKLVLDQQQYDSRAIPFKRGDIVDRNGTKIATSERVYNVILVQGHVQQEGLHRTYDPGIEGMFRDRGREGPGSHGGEPVKQIQHSSERDRL